MFKIGHFSRSRVLIKQKVEGIVSKSYSISFDNERFKRFVEIHSSMPYVYNILKTGAIKTDKEMKTCIFLSCKKTCCVCGKSNSINSVENIVLFKKENRCEAVCEKCLDYFDIDTSEKLLLHILKNQRGKKYESI